MTTRRLGTHGPEISRIGLGTWAIGGSGWKYAWGAQDDADSISVIHEAIDAGVNWIDTAAVYGFGHSEEVVGRAVRGKRSHVLLFTKCGRKAGSDGDITSELSAASVRDELEASLRRLGTDHIDLYQIHWPRPDGQIEEAWEEIAKAVKAGTVRYAGVSNFDPSQMQRLQAIHPITSLQPPLSLLRREIEAETLPYCARNGIGVICYSPLQMGLLTGTFSRERVSALPADDQRSRNDFFREPALTSHLAFVERLKPVAARNGRTVGELALAWVLSRTGVTAAIVGGRRAGQVRALVGAADWQLSSQDLVEISQALAEHQSRV